MLTTKHENNVGIRLSDIYWFSHNTAIAGKMFVLKTVLTLRKSVKDAINEESRLHMSQQKVSISNI